MTIVGSIRSVTKNESITRRVADPASKSTNGSPARSCGDDPTLLRERMIGRRHEQQLLAQDRNGNQVGLVDRQRQQPGVDTSGADLLHRPGSGRDGQPDVQLRMHALHVLEERRKHVEADRHAAGEPQRAAQRPGPIGDRADRVADVLKHTLTELDEAFGRRRHAHVSADAQKQRLAEFFLEQGNLPADRRLRHVQLPSARGKRPGIGNRLENFELAQIHDRQILLYGCAGAAAGARTFSSAIHHGMPGSVPTC